MDANIKELNKDVMLLIEDVLEPAALRKDFQNIIETLTARHPEATFSHQQWADLSIKKKCAAIERIRKTLASL